MTIKDFKGLRVYQISYEASMEIFEFSKSWPKVERYALTDQIRRSSRSVCANIAEAWSKRRYARHFVNKLTDAEGEAGETITWLDYAKDCGYMSADDHDHLTRQYRRVRGGLVKMMHAPEKCCGPSGLIQEPEVDYDP